MLSKDHFNQDISLKDSMEINHRAHLPLKIHLDSNNTNRINKDAIKIRPPLLKNNLIITNNNTSNTKKINIDKDMILNNITKWKNKKHIISIKDHLINSKNIETINNNNNQEMNSISIAEKDRENNPHYHLILQFTRLSLISNSLLN